MSKLPPCLRASSVIVGCNPLKTSRVQATTKHEPICISPHKCQRGVILASCQGRLRATSSLFSNALVRYAHTDIKVPDFTAYRPKNMQKPDVKTQEIVTERKVIMGMVSGTLITGGLYFGKTVVQYGGHSLAASRDVLALAQIEVKLNDIPEGRTAVIKWRGKPLFVKHRSPADIAREENTDLSLLRDPQRDQDRCKKPEWLVVIGICTHLGCVPTPNQGDYPGGMYCPCHGSHYDGSGRVRKGPAPNNLAVPPYEFQDENILIVG